MICNNCGVDKDLSCFRGIHKQCIVCLNAKTKLWIKNNKEKVKQNRKKYYLENKDYVLSRNKRYREVNKDKIQAYNKSAKRKNMMKEYYVDNNRKEYHREWRKNNRELVREINKKHRYSKKRKLWLEKNASVLRERTRVRRNKQRREDVDYRLLCNLRSRLHHALKGANKSQRTMKLVGCTIPFLKSWLENKFMVGMSWDNYGSVWVVDHVMPCASYDLRVKSEQEECFHYFNLQPLFVKDNLLKGDSVSFYL